MATTDRVRFGERSFDLVRVVGPALFDPRVHGIDVVTGSSVCPRGFYGIYDLRPRLTLRRLHARLTDDAFPARLATAVPHRRLRRTHRLIGDRWVVREQASWDHVYRDVDLPRRFTGSLWLGADRVPVPEWADDPLLGYRTVWDVMVEDGHIAAAIDCSSEVAGVRARLRNAPRRPTNAFDQRH